MQRGRRRHLNITDPDHIAGGLQHESPPRALQRSRAAKSGQRMPTSVTSAGDRGSEDLLTSSSRFFGKLLSFSVNSLAFIQV